MPTTPQVTGREHVSGLRLVSRGKVRDTYALPGDDQKLLSIATDRVSIFDFILPAEVSQKGEVLAATNAFWIQHLRRLSFFQDALGFGNDIDEYLPEKLRGNPHLQKRAIFVEKLKMIPVEAIVRGYLTGSGWTKYVETQPSHVVCGHSLPPDLKDGDRLPEPIFTPTTKAQEGHDEHLDAITVRELFGVELERRSLELFAAASEIAHDRGIILADTKLEFGHDSAGNLVLGDERFTPDSSRFWLLEDWESSRVKGTSPISFDKQFVREWGKTAGVEKRPDGKKRDPLMQEDLDYIQGLSVSMPVLLATRMLYRYVFYLLTGKRLETFQREDMGIPTPPPRVEVIVGSTSDLAQIEKGLDELQAQNISFRTHVISCHRNPDKLQWYASEMAPPNATIIAAAGKAAALPGVLQAWLQYYGKGHIPVIGVALKGETRADDEAAVLSIEQLPGNPVIRDDEGMAYFGSQGFHRACIDAATKDFFVPPSKHKIAQFDIPRTTST